MYVCDCVLCLYVYIYTYFVWLRLRVVHALYTITCMGETLDIPLDVAAGVKEGCVELLDKVEDTSTALENVAHFWVPSAAPLLKLEERYLNIIMNNLY